MVENPCFQKGTVRSALSACPPVAVVNDTKWCSRRLLVGESVVLALVVTRSVRLTSRIGIDVRASIPILWLIVLISAPSFAQNDGWEAGRKLLIMDQYANDRTEKISAQLRKGQIKAAEATMELTSLFNDYLEATNLVRQNVQAVAVIAEGTSTYHYNILSDLFDAQLMRIKKLRDACSIEASYGLAKARPLYDDQLVYYRAYKDLRKKAEKVWL